MYRTCYKILFFVIVLCFLQKTIKAQEGWWIKATPTGKVSVWITQLEPMDSLVFELMMINGSEELIEIDPLGVNTNYFNIKGNNQQYGAGTIQQCGWRKFYDYISPKTYKTWNIDVFQILQKAKAETNLHYTIIWDVGSSLGGFQAKPITFYFEK